MALNKEYLLSILKKNPVGVACGLLCVGLGVFVYLRLDAIPEAEASLVTNTSLVSRLSLNLSNSTHLKDQFDQLSEAKTQLDTRVVKASAIADNQRYFYRLEASTGAKLIDLRQSPSEPASVAGAYYKPVNFSVVLQGDFSHSLGFLRALDGGNYLYRINSLTLVPTGPGGSGSEVQSSLLTMSINLDLVGTP